MGTVIKVDFKNKQNITQKESKKDTIEKSTTDKFLEAIEKNLAIKEKLEQERKQHNKNVSKSYGLK